MKSKLRTYRLAKPFFSIRDFIWEKLRLFDVKKSIKQKRYFKMAAKEDAHRRSVIAQKIMALSDHMLHVADGVNLTVSMTSYGKRLEGACPYAIYSILTQKHLPNRIVLNVDKMVWNEDNLPLLVKKLQQVGVEIQLTEDMGPHTKLIPTLRNYPDDVVITVDDDVFYDKMMIEELYSEYLKSDKKSVVCREGKALQKKDGKYLPYSQQPHIRECGEASSLLPFGVAGVLYPPHIFGNEVFNTQVIADLCPKADDIWFGIMEIYYKIPVIYVAKNSWTGNADVDRNEEYNETVSGALHFLNDIQGLNDVQWNNLMEYYHLNNNENYENI